MFAFGFQRIGADEFREILRLVGGGGSRRPHLEQFNGDTAARTLPRRFRSSEAGTDDANFLMQIQNCSLPQPRVRLRIFANLFIIGRTPQEGIYGSDHCD
jgi:hypothetical protein